MSGGEAHALTAPPCVVKSTSSEGQQWLDETMEVGIGVLDWPRPQRICIGEPPPPAPASAPAKKKPLWKRWTS